ncbi:MAG: hypothetical protein FWE08_00490 [Oscillospiraceae bacterium]|nr:hypothetical protein [Oscillospiraceae bacterium]
MTNGNQNSLKEGSAIDKRLMKQARERVETRGFLKWMLGLGALISICKTILWFVIGNGERFWPGHFMAGWAFMMIILLIVFAPTLLSRSSSNRNKNDTKIMDEYEKLKRELEIT